MDTNLMVIVLATIAATYGAFNSWLDKRPPRPQRRAARARDKKQQGFL